MVQLLDQYGQPIKREVLRREVAGPTLGGVRQPLSGHPAAGLTPQRLARILREAEDGDPTRYLELAEEMEERDLHYAGVLGTRRRSIAQLPMTVIAAGDDAAAVGHADLVRAWLDRLDVESVLFDVLDAIGKGYSFTEIVWDTSAGQWLPARLEWRDPRWFGFDQGDHRTPMLRGDTGVLEALPPYKFVFHRHPAKSGLPVRAGLARLAAWSWMFKQFTTKDWQIFIGTYGQPLRLGKYGPEATAEDKEAMWRALVNIGTDCAAMIPKSMDIAFERAEGVTNDVMIYEKRCAWLDQQVSKAVLGQTTTTDAVSGGHAVSQEHRQVQEDIERADAKLLAATLTLQLVQPIVALNFGPQTAYPKLLIGREETVDLELQLKALEVLVPMGLKVQASEARDRFGFSDPDDGAELLTAPAPAPAATPSPLAGEGRGEGVPPSATARHAAGADRLARLRQRRTGEEAAPPAATVADRLAVHLDTAAGPVLDGLIDQVKAAIAAGRTLADAAGALQVLHPGLAVQDLTEVMSQAGAVAWLAGAADVLAEGADG